MLKLPYRVPPSGPVRTVDILELSDIPPPSPPAPLMFAIMPPIAADGVQVVTLAVGFVEQTLLSSDDNSRGQQFWLPPDREWELEAQCYAGAAQQLRTTIEWSQDGVTWARVTGQWNPAPPPDSAAQRYAWCPAGTTQGVLVSTRSVGWCSPLGGPSAIRYVAAMDSTEPSDTTAIWMPWMRAREILVAPEHRTAPPGWGSPIS